MTGSREFTFLSVTGEDDIYAREWLPEGGARAVLQLAHGVDEHIMRYDEFARFMAQAGFLVVGNDHIGHGRSVKSAEGLCVLNGSSGWTHMVGDMHALMLTEKARNPGLPYFLMGHSMGSFLTRTFLIKYPGEVNGAVLSGTGTTPGGMLSLGLLMTRTEGLRLGNKGRSKLLDSMCFSAYNKKFPDAKTPVDWLTRDPELIGKRLNDPLCNHIPSVRMYREMLGGIRFIQNKKNLLQMQKATPILFTSGECDPVGNMGAGPRAAYAAFKEAGCTDLSLKLYPDCRHEILNETNRREVYADVLAWLEGKL